MTIPTCSINSGYQGGFQGCRIIGRRSKPSTSMPPSSLSAKLAGPDHPLAATLAQPPLGGGEQRRQHLGVLLELEEAEPAPAGIVMFVEGVVDVRGDPPHDAARRGERGSTRLRRG